MKPFRTQHLILLLLVFISAGYGKAALRNQATPALTTANCPLTTEAVGIAAKPEARLWINGTEMTPFSGGWTYNLTAPGTEGGWVPWHVEGAGDAGAGPDAKAEFKGITYIPPAQENFTFDADGNRESSALWNYQWDGRNRLTGARTKNWDTAPKGYHLTFDYDAEGRRFKKHVKTYKNGDLESETHTTFVWDGWNLLYEIQTNALGTSLLERKYIWGESPTHSETGHLPCIRETKGAITTDLYPLFDGTGHLTALTNQNGNLLAEYAYGPFGELVHAKGPKAAANPWRYASKYFDVETGLYYFGERYFDPVSGQFLSREPLGESESLNLYNYGHGDPINNVDYRGLAAVALDSHQDFLDSLLTPFQLKELQEDEAVAFFARWKQQDNAETKQAEMLALALVQQQTRTQIESIGHAVIGHEITVEQGNAALLSLHHTLSRNGHPVPRTLAAQTQIISDGNSDLKILTATATGLSFAVPGKAVTTPFKFVANTAKVVVRGGQAASTTSRATRLRVLANILESQQARASSNFAVSRGAQLRAKYGHYTSVQRQARIQELAMGNRVLREAGVPRQYISEALQSFEPGTITKRIAGRNDFGLRFFGGGSGPKSPYLAPTFQGGNIRVLSAVPENNTLRNIMQWRIREGTPLLEGRIRAAFGQSGGGQQIYVPDYFNNLLTP